MTQVSLDGLTKRYGDGLAALDRLTLEVASGEMLALLGPSGCGKTTAMKLIAGLLQPDAGDVRFDGRSVVSDPPEARGAVMMFQNHLLFPSMTVGENVGFALKMRGAPRAEIARRVAQMLDRVRLPGFEDRRPQALSGGQQQRVALARALIAAPKVLLLDEPLSSLDPHLREEMGDLIRALQQEAGVTAIIVTHDRAEAAALADRVAILREGRLAQVGAPAALMRRPADEATARFLGGRNFIKGVSANGAFEAPGVRLALPPDALDGPGLLTFRPEAARIGALAGGANTVEATLVSAADLGDRLRLVVRLGEAEAEIAARPGEADGLVPGDRLSATLPREALWVLER
ncbi:MAG: ABC transporter ATP-binding protein [Pseudomonadota bacterium]